MACACCNHGSLQLQYRPSSIDYNEYNTNYKRLGAFESFDTLQYEVVVDGDRWYVCVRPYKNVYGYIQYKYIYNIIYTETNQWNDLWLSTNCMPVSRVLISVDIWSLPNAAFPKAIAPLVGQELSGFTSGSENDNGSHLLPLQDSRSARRNSVEQHPCSIRRIRHQTSKITMYTSYHVISCHISISKDPLEANQIE